MVLSPSRRSDPDLDITEIGDIRSDDGQYGSGGCLNARRPTSMGGAYWAEFWVAVIIYIKYRRARARALLEAVPPVFEIKWGTDEASLIQRRYQMGGCARTAARLQCQLGPAGSCTNSTPTLIRLVIKRPLP